MNHIDWPNIIAGSCVGSIFTLFVSIIAGVVSGRIVARQKVDKGDRPTLDEAANTSRRSSIWSWLTRIAWLILSRFPRAIPYLWAGLVGTVISAALVVPLGLVIFFIEGSFINLSVDLPILGIIGAVGGILGAPWGLIVGLLVSRGPERKSSARAATAGGSIVGGPGFIIGLLLNINSFPENFTPIIIAVGLSGIVGGLAGLRFNVYRANRTKK